MVQAINVQAKSPSERPPSFQVTWRRLGFESKQSNWERCLGSCNLFQRTRKLFTSRSSSSYNLNEAASRSMNNSTMTMELGLANDQFTSKKATLPMAQQHEQHKRLMSLNGINGTHTRVIFKNLNGMIRSDQLTAILGPSGAGKTSLLNAICGRTENYKGIIELKYDKEPTVINDITQQATKIDFKPPKKILHINNNSNNGNDYLSRRTLRLSIIPQKDYLIENLSVYENLMYASKLLNCHKSHFNHKANIQRVVKMLNLSNCIDSRVSTISGGEYKRVSIGQELLSQPDILILDEPTSGLDSLNCKNLIFSLNQLIEASRSGSIQPIAIVMTIHQPDIDIFNRFDRIYCLAKGGRVIFDGRPSDALGLLREQVGHLLQQTQAQLHNNQELDQQLQHQQAQQNTIDLFNSNVNPANLLIEIASEDIYGNEPIEILAQHQREQFELEHPEMLNRLTRHKSSEQLALNLLLDSNNNKNDSDDYAGKQPAFGASSENVATLKGSKSLSSFHQGPIATTPSSDANLTPHQQSPQSTSSMTSAIILAKSEYQLIRDKRLSTTKNDSNNHRFFYQTFLLTQRAFKSALRDPLMTLTSLVFHLIIPFVMWSVYSKQIGTVKACPIVEREIDLLALGKNETINLVAKLQEELMSALECSTMFFLSTYSFSMCSLSIAALAFPLNMHVLLKETRNGWYNLSSYVVAKTFASFPFEVLFPVVSITMIYLLLGMPSSDWNWRLLALMGVMALISMISHTQGLIFGALCMDSVQTAIFLASATTLPQALLSGFTARIKNMPVFLQHLSWLSLYRYSSDCINIIRFGYGICECDQSTDKYLAEHEPTLVNFRDLPPNAHSLAINYLTQYRTSTRSVSESLNGDNSSVSNVTTYIKPEQITGINYRLLVNDTESQVLTSKIESNEVDLFSGIAEMAARSLSFGQDIESCKDVRSQLLQTTSAPQDHSLPYLFGGMLILLLAYRIGLFIAVKCKLSSRI